MEKKIFIAWCSDYECSTTLSVHETEDGAKNACHEDRKKERKKWHESTRALYNFMIQHPESLAPDFSLTELRKQQPFMDRNFWGVSETELLN